VPSQCSIHYFHLHWDLDDGEPQLWLLVAAAALTVRLPVASTPVALNHGIVLAELGLRNLGHVF